MYVPGTKLPRLICFLFADVVKFGGWLCLFCVRGLVLDVGSVLSRLRVLSKGLPSVLTIASLVGSCCIVEPRFTAFTRSRFRVRFSLWSELEAPFESLASLSWLTSLILEASTSS